MTDNIRTIEVEGLKIGVDLRSGKTVDVLRVGDPVKVLTKQYSDYKQGHGVVVGFDDYPDLPTILIAYIEQTYSKSELKLLVYNKEAKDVHVIAANENDISFDKTEVENWFAREIEKHQMEIKDLESRRRYFRKHFGTVFGDVMETEES